MKKIVSIFIIMVFFIIAGTITFYVFVGKTAIEEYNKFDKNTEALKELVGEQVILKGDTLLVIDYSSVNNTVTLDDNCIISGELAKKLDKVDE